MLNLFLSVAVTLSVLAESSSTATSRRLLATGVRLPCRIDFGLSIGLISINNTHPFWSPDDDRRELDTFTPHVAVDITNAKAFCKDWFGPNSVPAYPQSATALSTMGTMCGDKFDNSNDECYIGLFRKEDDITTNELAAECDNWYHTESTGARSSSVTYTTSQLTGSGTGELAGLFAANQPICHWLPTSDPLYTGGNKNECLGVQSNGRLTVINCSGAHHIFCTYDSMDDGYCF